MPWARMEKTFASALQSIPNSSNTAVVFTNWLNIAAGESGEGVFSGPDAASQDLNVLVQGIYLVKIAVYWATTAVGAFRAGISKNTGIISWIMERDTSLFGGQTEFEATGLMHMDGSVAPAFSLILFQASGAARNLDAAFLHAVKLSDYTGDDWFDMNPDQA